MGRKEEIEKEFAQGEKIYNIAYYSFVIFEIIVLLILFLMDYIEGGKGILWAVAFLVFSMICMEQLDFSSATLYHGIFLWIKIKLSCHMFTQIIWIVLSVVIMTLLNMLIKKILKYITNKWCMYWKTPMGM